MTQNQQQIKLKQQVAVYLDQLEAELRALNWWEVPVPNAEALASSQPFAVDTLRLEEWLRWIFVPRLRAIIESEASLPLNCQVAPMAEHTYAQQALEVQQLVRCLEALDEAISNQ